VPRWRDRRCGAAVSRAIDPVFISV